MRLPSPRLLVLAGFILALPLASAAPTVVAIEESDPVEIQVSGNAATVAVTLARAPSNVTDPTLQIANRDGYVFWSAPLARQGNRWTATLDRAGLQSYVMVNRMLLNFPGAAEGGEALQLVIPSERLTPEMAKTSSLLGQEPLFFAPPKAPELPEVPTPEVERVRAESFAMSARRWDRELSAHRHEFAAARSRAHALFLDLRTAGRLPWNEQQLSQLENAYQKLSQQEQAIQKLQTDWRANAEAFIQRWNAAHSGEPPIELKFAEAA